MLIPNGFLRSMSLSRSISKAHLRTSKLYTATSLFPMLSSQPEDSSNAESAATQLTSSLHFPDVHPNSWRHAAPNVAGGGRNIRNKVQASSKHHRPKFQPGPWKDAYATFYEGDSGSFAPLVKRHFSKGFSTCSNFIRSYAIGIQTKPRGAFPPHEDINWMSKGVLNPVQDQNTAGCNTCASFSGILTFEAAVKIEGAGELQKYSEQHMVDCLHFEGHDFEGSSHGAQIFYVFQYLMKKGLSVARDYPNTGTHDQFYQQKIREVSTTIDDYQVLMAEDDEYRPFIQWLAEGHLITFPQNDDSALIKAVSERPVAVSLCISQDDLTGYDPKRESVYDGLRPTNPKDRAYHAVVIVALVDNIWILRNSYGPDWGNFGHMLLTREAMMRLMIYATYPLVHKR